MKKTSIDLKSGEIVILNNENTSFVSGNVPVFNIMLRKQDGEAVAFSAFDACELRSVTAIPNINFKTA